MNSVPEIRPVFNKGVKINFDGGDLSSDAGLLLLREFAQRIDLHELIGKQFKTKDLAQRWHTDAENLLQMVYQKIAGYFRDDDADELTDEPVFRTLLDKNALASQPTLSRFHNRMDEDTLKQFNSIQRELRRRIHRLTHPDMMLFDIDSTLFETFGEQEGEAFNYHYNGHGYHPLLCYDGLTGDLLKAVLREGNVYTSRDVTDFMKPLLTEYRHRYPGISLYLRGDSGFAVPELYEQLERSGVSYAIRLKDNAILSRETEWMEAELNERTRLNKIDSAVEYGEFVYQANTWKSPRRVVVKMEKPQNQMVCIPMYIVTNMDLPPESLIQFYCNRGRMENFIKESKNGFDFDTMSSHSMTVNANRLQLSVLAYNFFNWFRRLVLPDSMRKLQIDTLRLKLLKIAAKIIKAARYLTFKLCSSCPYQEEFRQTFANIQRLAPLLM
jgi:hypothetical protein